MSAFHDAATPEDLPPSHQGEPVEDEPDDDEPADDDDTGRYDESASYRDSMIDAGRGHLVRHL